MPLSRPEDETGSTSAKRPTALVTGASRGIGAATARALARRGVDVAITYRNKASRAEGVAADVRTAGSACLSIPCDITRDEDLERLFDSLRAWRSDLDLVILNASGGLERDLVAADEEYPRKINRDAQLALVDHALCSMPQGGTIVFVTSHWAHLWGQVEQLPAYTPVAQSKWEGEMALRARLGELTERGVRLLLVTGDLVEGTITPKLLERAGPGMSEERKAVVGVLPTAEEMGDAIASAALDESLPSGHTIVVGGALESLFRT